MSKKILATAILAAALLTFLSAQSAWAQAKFPTKPVQMVVARAPGGSSDAGARGLQPFLQKVLGVSVVVNNIAGASGIVGTNKVYDSPADGYTLLIGSNSDLVRYHMNATQTKFGASFLKGFVPLAAFVNEDVGALCVNKSSDFKTFADLLAKAKKDRVTVGIGGGVGSTDHLVVLMIEKYFGGNWQVVPFPSGGEAAASLLGSHIDAGSFGITGAADSAKFRLLAQSGPKRVRQIPDVPTYVELGQKDLVMDYHLGLFVKIGTPPAIMKTLETAILTAANDPGFKKWAEDTKTPTGAAWDAKTFTEYMQQADKNSALILPMLEKSLKELQQGGKK
jgi:tripartite-type tricarboxylate transporter receptor subunit TctC